MSALDTNIEKLAGFLARFKEAGIKNRIAGEDRQPGILVMFCHCRRGLLHHRQAMVPVICGAERTHAALQFLALAEYPATADLGSPEYLTPQGG